MKIKTGFELRDVCGEKVIIATGIENIDFSRMISLNESAAFLWENIQDKEFDAETLAELLLQEYEIFRLKTADFQFLPESQPASDHK